MNRKLILTLMVVILGANAFGQVLKYRVGGNYSKFNKETGSAEIIHPIVKALSQSDSTDFTHVFEPGFEAELMLLWSPNFETGFEFEYSNLSGTNDVPPMYNYFYSADGPSNFTSTSSKKYETSVMSFILNLRYYIAPDGKVKPFFKVMTGVSMVATEFNYIEPNPAYEYESAPIYALGTDNSDKPREAAFYYGGGLGIDFKLSEKLSLYVDGTASIINSDKVDGIPNYNYNATQQTLKSVGNSSLVTQISVGLVFTSNTDLGLNKNRNSGGIKRTGQTTPWRPFYRQK